MKTGYMSKVERRVTSAILLDRTLAQAGMTDDLRTLIVNTPDMALAMVALAEAMANDDGEASRAAGTADVTPALEPIHPDAALKDVLKARTYYKLARVWGVKTVLELSFLSEKQLHTLRGIGDKSMAEVKAVMARAGLTLRGEDQNVWTKVRETFPRHQVPLRLLAVFKSNGRARGLTYDFTPLIRQLASLPNREPITSIDMLADLFPSEVRDLGLPGHITGEIQAIMMQLGVDDLGAFDPERLMNRFV